MWHARLGDLCGFREFLQASSSWTLGGGALSACRCLAPRVRARSGWLQAPQYPPQPPPVQVPPHRGVNPVGRNPDPVEENSRSSQNSPAPSDFASQRGALRFFECARPIGFAWRQRPSESEVSVDLGGATS